ncbi:MAG: hypothetical protein FWD75_10170 [Propionibacteriaceae bacterium]|nr:hypothetical protein [Propionibacteriaceae bacterium]
MKIKTAISATFLALSMSVGLGLAGMPTALADPIDKTGSSSGCSGTWTTGTTTSTISGVSCYGGAHAYPWIKYYASDNTTQITTANGASITSGSSTASRPSTSFAYQAGFTVVL